MNLPFGKFKDRSLSVVPLDYLTWLFQNVTMREPLNSEVILELDRRKFFYPTTVSAAALTNGTREAQP